MTKEVFLGGVGLIKALAEDLPDGMWEDVKEQLEEIKSMIARGVYVDWDLEAQSITEICHEYGLSSVFGEEPFPGQAEEA